MSQISKNISEISEISEPDQIIEVDQPEEVIKLRFFWLFLKSKYIIFWKKNLLKDIQKKWAFCLRFGLGSESKVNKNGIKNVKYK